MLKNPKNYYLITRQLIWLQGEETDERTSIDLKEYINKYSLISEFGHVMSISKNNLENKIHNIYFRMDKRWYDEWLLNILRRRWRGFNKMHII